ncbi:hypothetical protein RYH80_18130 [Halobaculum sp. MBLA0147]|uniref:hypothetical protein n=1 Tax=Halobaculum sp. MBLA0147 TaxID=3079934 RepID=UPI00352648F8
MTEFDIPEDARDIKPAPLGEEPRFNDGFWQVIAHLSAAARERDDSPPKHIARIAVKAPAENIPGDAIRYNGEPYVLDRYAPEAVINTSPLPDNLAGSGINHWVRAAGHIQRGIDIYRYRTRSQETHE